MLSLPEVVEALRDTYRAHSTEMGDLPGQSEREMALRVFTERRTTVNITSLQLVLQHLYQETQHPGLVLDEKEMEDWYRSRAYAWEQACEHTMLSFTTKANSNSATYADNSIITST